MSRRPEHWSFTLRDISSSDSARKRAAASGATVIDEFSSVSDVMAQNDDQQYIDNDDNKKDLPKLPGGTSKLCYVLSCCVFMCCCLVPAILVWSLYSFFPETIMPFLPFLARDVDGILDANARAVRRDETIRDAVELGLWDSQQRATPLQLQVALSQALGVRAEDEDVHVTTQQNLHFFEIRIDHGTQEECVYIDSVAFLTSLNTHLAQFSATAVVTHSPRLVKFEAEKQRVERPPKPTRKSVLESRV